ncbi:MAG: protease complex subunit PrcB family protein [Bacillota bacterium]
MKRMHWLITVTTAIAVVTAGCGGVAPKADAPPDQNAAKPEPAPAVAEGSQPEAAGFELIKESMLPTELDEWKRLPQPPKSTGSARVGDYLYVLVTGGTESIGASAIAVKHVQVAEREPPVFTVTAVLSPGKSGAETASFPKSYIRIPYPASRPVPGVMIRVEWQGAKAEPDKSPTKPVDPNTPVSSPATTTPTAPATKAPEPKQPAIADGAATISTIPANALPASLSTWVQSTVNVPGGAAKYVDGTLYLMVSGGQRNTGGYAVEIKSAEMKEGTLYVSAVLHSPQPGQMVTQAITYPKAYARLDLPGSGEPGVIVNWK